MRYVLAAILLALSAPVAAQHYYDPGQPGHGLTVQRVGSDYVAQWYVNGVDGQRWFVTDVCSFGEACPAYAVQANGFPAVGAESVEAGFIVLVEDGDGAVLSYDLHIEGVDCSQLLPGPLPGECVNPDGSRNWDYNDRFSASGEVELERLID